MLEKMNSFMLKAKLASKLTDKKIDQLKTIGVFLLVFIVTFLQYCQPTHVSMIADRMGDLAVPAYLAGFDWHVMVSQTNYYGFGWKWIYFIFFKITQNPFTVFYIVEILWTLIYSVLYTALYVKLAEKKSNYFVFLFFIPVLSTIYTFHPFSSEPTLYMSIIVMVLLIIHLFESEKCVVDSVLIALWIVYMTLLHERSTGLIVSFAFIIVFDFIITRKLRLKVIPFFATLVPLLIVKKFFMGKVISVIWAGATVKNTSAIGGNFTWFFQNFYTFKIVVLGIVSNFVVICIKTYGIFLLMTVFCIWLILGLIFKRDVWGEFYRNHKICVLVILFSFVSVMGTIAAMCMQSCRSVSLGNPYGYKFYVYVRYYLPWAIVGIIALLSIWKDLLKLINKWFFLALSFVYLAMGILYLKYVYPVLVVKNDLAYNAVTGNNFRFYLVGLFAKITATDFDNLLLSVLVGFIVLVCLSLNKKTIQNYCFAVILFLSVYNSTLRFDISKPSFFNSEESFYDAITVIDKSIEIPKDIYCTSGVENRVYMLQYMLMNHTINNSLPKQNDPDNTIVLTWSKYDDYSQTLADNGYNCITIAPAHYLWCKDSELLSDIETLLDQNGALKPYIQIEFADEETVNESEV